MGIKKLNKVLESEAPEAIYLMEASKFAGKRIAIDGNFMAHQFMSIARKAVLERMVSVYPVPEDDIFIPQWLKEFAIHVELLTALRITPVFVIDGKPHPEKIETNNKRNTTVDTARSALQLLYSQITSEEMITEVLKEQIKRKLANINEIGAKNYDILARFLSNLGVPVIRAVLEADEVCSALAYDGFACGVITRDTDVLAHGCPLMIRNFRVSYRQEIIDGDKLRIPIMEVVNLNLLLEKLELTHSEFVDVCIMLGCDYNQKLSRIGHLKTYREYKQLRSVSDMMKRHGSSKLNYKKCKRIFSHVSTASLVDEFNESMLNINKDRLSEMQDYFDSLGIAVDKLAKYYARMDEPSNGFEGIEPKIATPERWIVE